MKLFYWVSVSIYYLYKLLFLNFHEMELVLEPFKTKNYLEVIHEIVSTLDIAIMSTEREHQCFAFTYINTNSLDTYWEYSN